MKQPTIASLFLLSAASLTACAQPAPTTPPSSPLDWKSLENPILKNQIQLTTRSQFTRAGEAYFSPDGRWIIFQAIDEPPQGKPADSFYAMYAARLEISKSPRLTGIERVSPPDSANTCGWFDPVKPWRVIFGSTLVRPSDEQKSGFQVGTRRYVWMFPEETDVVERVIEPIYREHQKVNANRTGLPNPIAPIFSRPNYDAECSYSKDARFILYAHVEDRPADLPEGTPHQPDANIYIYDTKTQKHTPIIVAPGYDGGPFFSPDGKSICYRSDRKGNDHLQIFVADLAFANDKDGTPIPSGITHEYQLTDNDHVNWAPYWHPSGKFLVYATSEISHRNYEVFAIEVDRTKLVNAATVAAVKIRPDPDGRADHKAPTIKVPNVRKSRITQADGADVLPAFSFDGKYMMWTSQRGPKLDAEDRPSSQLWIAEFNAAQLFADK